jgi:hypothetical protein
MCAYEFYRFDKTEKAHFIGILQENRENLLRKSIKNNTGIYPEFGKEGYR